MVTLSRITTRTGDQGETALGDGTRVPKDHPRVAATGTVDELNAVLGLVLVSAPEVPEAGRLRRVQNDLFDVGADLCVPGTQGGLRVTAFHVANLDEAIQHTNASLQPLRSFVLPGGTVAAAWLHVARTVCRRAERDVVTLAAAEPVNPQVVMYLNRLSDWLFVLSRSANVAAGGDVLWVPGAGSSAANPA